MLPLYEDCRALGKLHFVLLARPHPEEHAVVRETVLKKLAKATPKPTPKLSVSSCLTGLGGRLAADILAYAAGEAGLTAFDTGIASTDSQPAAAHGDAREALRLGKQRDHRHLAEDLRAASRQYVPLPRSCWGRERADLHARVVVLARRLAALRCDLFLCSAPRSCRRWNSAHDPAKLRDRGDGAHSKRAELRVCSFFLGSFVVRSEPKLICGPLQFAPWLLCVY